MRVYRKYDLFEPHSSASFWRGLATVWLAAFIMFFLEYGDSDDPRWWGPYYVWEYSIHVLVAVLVCTGQRYLMLILSPLLIFTLLRLVTEVYTVLTGQDPNQPQVIRELLGQCALACIFITVLLEAFPWENSRSSTWRLP